MLGFGWWERRELILTMAMMVVVVNERKGHDGTEYVVSEVMGRSGE